jgi:hypothetical protein
VISIHQCSPPAPRRSHGRQPREARHAASRSHNRGGGQPVGRRSRCVHLRGAGARSACAAARSGRGNPSFSSHHQVVQGTQPFGRGVSSSASARRDRTNAAKPSVVCHVSPKVRISCPIMVWSTGAPRLSAANSAIASRNDSRTSDVGSCRFGIAASEAPAVRRQRAVFSRAHATGPRTLRLAT